MKSLCWQHKYLHTINYFPSTLSLIIFQLFEPLVSDLRHLEKEGTAGVAVYCGDNLELHELGMFNRCFSGGHICRFCVINYGNLGDCDGFLRHQLWDEEKYNAIAAALENGEDVESFSLRGNCVLNELDSFHATKSFGPDLMHDFMEGNRFKQHRISDINVIILIDIEVLVQCLIINGFRCCCPVSSI